ncbi:type III effector [Pseudomonas syringae group genomosp. 3]|uniref:type III effector n=1 Tax=Pseudomonas syringae group genomosp. 3 TaxID=251701 RepID=UPI00287BB052|nr:type III effector [Pseudomonas syringae group genomosp. 3]
MAHQVNSPDRVNNSSGDNQNDIVGELLSLRHQLSEAVNLPQHQVDFLNNEAPQALRDNYRNLDRTTRSDIWVADMHHRRLTQGGQHPGPPTQESINNMQSRISAWHDMNEALDHAMQAHNNIPQQYVPTMNPSGSIRMATLTPRPWEN